MLPVSRNLKSYFAIVGLSALYVGMWAFFFPEHVDKGMPWLIPALHARFIGAIYLSAPILLGASMLARHYFEVRIGVFIIAIWTGALFVISLFYLSELDFNRTLVKVWVGTYLLYPLIGLWLTWIHRNVRDESVSPNIPSWIRNYFFVQGIIITILALALLLIPELMISVWPWKITYMLAQIYSGPIVAYGIGSIMLSRQRTMSEVRIVTLGIFVLAIGALVASIIHRALFTLSNPATWIWFGGFILIALVHGTILMRNFSAGDSK
jgi:hypothetical protein